MKAYEIEALASKFDPTHIFHPKRNSIYKVLGFQDVKVQGQWVQHVAYMDLKSRKMYARTANNFAKFSVY